jgi:hypothetical protein
MANTTYQAGDWVMIADVRWDEPVSFGIVLEDSKPGDQWIRARCRSADGATSTMVPGFRPELVARATAHDVDALHPSIRDWAERCKLDREDPPIPRRVSGKSIQALGGYGIKRLSNLKRASDTDLLKLKGVGGKTLTALRQWQAATEEQLCPF